MISAHLDSLDAAMADGSFDSIFNQGSTCKKCTSLFPQSTVSRLRYWIIRRIQRFSDPNPEIWLSFYEVSQSARKGCAICRLVLGYHMLYRGEKRPFDDYGLSLHCWVSFLRIRSGSQLLSLTHDFQNSSMPPMTLNSNFAKYLEGDTRPGPDEPCTLGTDSPQCLALAKSWLDSCFDSHSKCKMGRDAEGWLPTRLIDIRRKATPRLVITSDLLDVRNTTYATLSHRWSTSPVLRLTTANIEAFKRSIPVGSLSDVFREAIKFVNSLGIPYIWIDSLCIVQDEISDWEQESALMGDVYRNGVVNIAATGNADFGGGLFQRRDPQWVTPSRICLRHKSRTMNYAVMPLRKVWHHWVTASALNKRGWVLQERLLSPRTIHMGKQLFWECREGRACETHPKPIRYISTKPDFFISNLDMGNSLKDLSRAADTPSFWFDLIKEYGACNITKQEDKLYALVGVAKFLQPILNDVYLAGLWQKDLPYNLTWRIEGEEKRGRPDAYRCKDLEAHYANLLTWDRPHLVMGLA